MVLGAFFTLLIFLACLGGLLEQLGKARIGNADELWLKDQKDEAVRIYINEISNVEEADRPEIYKRIITHLYNTGNVKGATEYCTKAIEEEINVRFVRNDLRRVLDNARQAVEAQLEEKKKASLDEVEYEIVNDESYLDCKRRVNVSLAEKVSRKVLEALAHKIKNSSSKKYKRTFICYYLPDMTIDAGAWATTHFTPTLEVKILGLSLEDESMLKDRRKSKEANSPEELVGRWLDTSVAGLEHEITVFKKNGKFYMRNSYKDKSESTHECRKRRIGNKLFLKWKESKLGDYFAIDANGDLWHGDKEEGLWGKCKKIK
jgi:hypothetical protein